MSRASSAARSRAVLALALPLLAASAGAQHELTGGAELLWHVEQDKLVPRAEDQARVLTHDGVVFLIARASTPLASRVEIQAFDETTGTLLWSTAQPSDGPLTLVDVEVAFDGAEVYTLGSVEVDDPLVPDGTKTGSRITCYDAANGDEISTIEWAAPAGEHGELTALTTDNDGYRVFAVGWIGTELASDKYVTVGYTTDDAALIFETTYEAVVDPGIGGETAGEIDMHPGENLIYVTGSSSGAVLGWDYLTICYTTGGGRQWIARHSGPTPGTDRPTELKVSPDGTQVVVVGDSDGGDEIVMYTSATGVQEWTASMETGSELTEQRAAYAPDGATVFVIAEVEKPGADTDVRVTAFDADTGAELWTVDYDSPVSTGSFDFDRPRAVSASHDSTAVFVGISSGTGESSLVEAVTIALDASTGATLWSVLEPVGSPGGIEATDLVASRIGGRVFAAGDRAPSYPDGESADATLVALGASGGFAQWQASVSSTGSGNDRAHDVAVSPDGSRLAVAYLASAGYGAFGGLAMRDATDGSQVWTGHEYYNALADPPGAARTAFSPDGTQVYLVRRALTTDVHVEAFAMSDGSSQWSVTLNDFTSWDDATLDLLVAESTGVIYITRPFDDYVTTALDPTTGATIWESRYDANADIDYAHALTLSPDESILYVTGQSVLNFLVQPDLTTVAYDAATGAELSTWRFAGLSGGSTGTQVGLDAAVSPDGTILVECGRSGFFFDHGLVTAHDTSSGTLLWSASVIGDGTGDQRCSDVVVDGAAAYVLTSINRSVDSLSDFEADIQLDAYALDSGAVLWTTVLDEAPVDEGFDLSLEGDDSTLFLTGRTGDDSDDAMRSWTFDTATGELLWSATFDNGAGAEAGTALALDAAGHRLYAAGTSFNDVSHGDVSLTAYAVPSLVGKPDELSAVAGGTHDLFLRADADLTGQLYVVAGSLSGTSPGFFLDGLHIPLNPDGYTTVTLGPSSPLVGGTGLLDGKAQGVAHLTLPPGLTASLVGLSAAHAYGIVDPLGQLVFVSNAATLEITP